MVITFYTFDGPGRVTRLVHHPIKPQTDKEMARNNQASGTARVNKGREHSTDEYKSIGLDSSNTHPSEVTPSPNRNEVGFPRVGMVREGLGIRYDVPQLKKDHE